MTATDEVMRCIVLGLEVPEDLLRAAATESLSDPHEWLP